MNCLENAVDVAENVVVPEAQDAIPVIDKLAIAKFIMVGFGMLSAINFDDQSAFAAYEITNVTANWFLPHKFVIGDLSVTQAMPKFCFRIGLADAQFACSRGRFAIWSTHSPAPHPDRFTIRPLPASGER